MADLLSSSSSSIVPRRNLVPAPDVVAPKIGDIVIYNPWGNDTRRDYSHLTMQVRNNLPENPDVWSKGVEEVSEEEKLRRLVVNNPDHLQWIPFPSEGFQRKKIECRKDCTIQIQLISKTHDCAMIDPSSIPTELPGKRVRFPLNDIELYLYRDPKIVGEYEGNANNGLNGYANSNGSMNKRMSKSNRKTGRTTGAGHGLLGVNQQQRITNFNAGLQSSMMQPVHGRITGNINMNSSILGPQQLQSQRMSSIRDTHRVSGTGPGGDQQENQIQMQSINENSAMMSMNLGTGSGQSDDNMGTVTGLDSMSDSNFKNISFDQNSNIGGTSNYGGTRNQTYNAKSVEFQSKNEIEAQEQYVKQANIQGFLQKCLDFLLENRPSGPKQEESNLQQNRTNSKTQQVTSSANGSPIIGNSPIQNQILPDHNNDSNDSGADLSQSIDHDDPRESLANYLFHEHERDMLYEEISLRKNDECGEEVDLNKMFLEGMNAATNLNVGVLTGVTSDSASDADPNTNQQPSLKPGQVQDYGIGSMHLRSDQSYGLSPFLKQKDIAKHAEHSLQRIIDIRKERQRRNSFQLDLLEEDGIKRETTNSSDMGGGPTVNTDTNTNSSDIMGGGGGGGGGGHGVGGGKRKSLSDQEEAMLSREEIMKEKAFNKIRHNYEREKEKERKKNNMMQKSERETEETHEAIIIKQLSAIPRDFATEFSNHTATTNFKKSRDISRERANNLLESNNNIRLNSKFNSHGNTNITKSSSMTGLSHSDGSQLMSGSNRRGSTIELLAASKRMDAFREDLSRLRAGGAGLVQQSTGLGVSSRRGSYVNSNLNQGTNINTNSNSIPEDSQVGGQQQLIPGPQEDLDEEELEERFLLGIIAEPVGSVALGSQMLNNLNSDQGPSTGPMGFRKSAGPGIGKNLNASNLRPSSNFGKNLGDGQLNLGNAGGSLGQTSTVVSSAEFTNTIEEEEILIRNERLKAMIHPDVDGFGEKLVLSMNLTRDQAWSMTIQINELLTSKQQDLFEQLCNLYNRAAPGKTVYVPPQQTNNIAMGIAASSILMPGDHHQSMSILISSHSAHNMGVSKHKSVSLALGSQYLTGGGARGGGGGGGATSNFNSTMALGSINENLQQQDHHHHHNNNTNSSDDQLDDDPMELSRNDPNDQRHTLALQVDYIGSLRKKVRANTEGQALSVPGSATIYLQELFESLQSLLYDAQLSISEEQTVEWCAIVKEKSGKGMDIDSPDRLVQEAEKLLGRQLNNYQSSGKTKSSKQKQ